MKFVDVPTESDVISSDFHDLFLMLIRKFVKIFRDLRKFVKIIDIG